MRSTMVDLDGPVHLTEWGEGKVRFVLVHGLGGSSVNWMTVGDRLAARGRVVAPDLAGFGRTRVAGRRATVAQNRALLHRVVTSVAEDPVLLVGNSMGGLISVLETAAHPELIAGLVLVDSAMPLPGRATLTPMSIATIASAAIPGLGVQSARQMRKRLGVEKMVRRTLALCAADLRRVADDVVEAHVESARARGDLLEHDKAFVSAARSIVVALIRRRRFRRLTERITVPTLLIHGDRDRLIRVAAARRLASQRPDWELHILKDVGHIPQLEVPDRFMRILEDWLDRKRLAEVTVTGASTSSVPAANLV